MLIQISEEGTDGDEGEPEFNYQSVIGKLNFLEKSTRPDCSISVLNQSTYIFSILFLYVRSYS